MFICLEEGDRWLPLIFTPSVGTQSSVAKPTCGFPVGSPWGLSLWDVIIQSQYSIKLRCIIHCDLYPNCFQDIPNHEISLQCSKKPCNIFNCNTHSCVYLDWSPAVISWNKKNKRRPLHCHEREVRLTHERMGVFPEHYHEGLGTTFLLSARDQSFLHA